MDIRPQLGTSTSTPEPGQRPMGVPSSGHFSPGYLTYTAMLSITDALDDVNVALAAINVTATTALALAESSQTDASQQPLGAPTSGDWSGGYAALLNATKIVDAFQLVNASLSTVSTVANTGVSNAATAQTTANAGAASAAAAQSTANLALSGASSAQGTANTALTNAAAAQTTANTAATNATAAQGTANTALTNAAAAQTTANTAATNATAAQGTANTALTNAAAAQTTANSPGQQAAGTPTGGWTTGYTTFTALTKITDAINTLNVVEETIATSIAGIIAGSTPFTGDVTFNTNILFPSASSGTAAITNIQLGAPGNGFYGGVGTNNNVHCATAGTVAWTADASQNLSVFGQIRLGALITGSPTSPLLRLQSSNFGFFYDSAHGGIAWTINGTEIGYVNSLGLTITGSGAFSGALSGTTYGSSTLGTPGAFYYSAATGYSFGFADVNHSTIYTAGVSAASFDSTQNGFLSGAIGIGVAPTTGYINLTIKATTTGTGQGVFSVLSPTGSVIYVIEDNGKVAFSGTTGTGSSGTAASCAFNLGNNVGVGLYSPAAGQLGLASNGLAALTFDTSQNANFKGSIGLLNSTILNDSVNGTLQVTTSASSFGSIQLGAIGASTGVRLSSAANVFRITDGAGGASVITQLGTGTADEGGSGGLSFGTVLSSSAAYLYKNGTTAFLLLTNGSRSSNSAVLGVGTLNTATINGGSDNSLSALGGRIAFSTSGTGSVSFSQATGTLTGTGFMFNGSIGLLNSTIITDTANGTLQVASSTGAFGSILLGSAGSATGILISPTNGNLLVTTGSNGIATLQAFTMFPNRLAINQSGSIVSAAVASMWAPNGTTLALGIGATQTATFTSALALFNSSSGIGWQGSTANGEYGSLVSVTGVTTLSGATTNSSFTIPAGSLVVGVVTRVTTTITGTAVTSYTIGDGTTANAYGTAIALAAGTTTTNTNWTLTNPKMYMAATNIVFTATGGIFSGGVVRCTVFYISTTAPTS